MDSFPAAAAVAPWHDVKAYFKPQSNLNANEHCLFLVNSSAGSGRAIEGEKPRTSSDRLVALDRNSRRNDLAGKRRFLAQEVR